MQASEWPYYSSNYSNIVSCSRYGYIATAYSNILTIYKNTTKGLIPISASITFQWNIQCLSWCTASNSESSLPLTLFIGFDHGNGSIVDIPTFSIICTINVSKSAIISSAWSNISPNHLFLGCENGDLISITFVKSAENKTDLSVIISWVVQTGFPINQLSINYSDCNTLISASHSGRFILYENIYEENPTQLFSGTFEHNDQENHCNLVKCGFHPYANDIFYIVTDKHIYYGFVKEKSTITLFPSSPFSHIVGIFFPISDHNSLVVIQKSSSFLLHYSDAQRWKRIQEVPHFNSYCLSMENTEFDKDSYLLVTKGSNLSIIKFFRKKLFVVTFLRNLNRKPMKIAVNHSFFAFFVQNKSKTKNPANCIYLYLAPQTTTYTGYCLYYNLNIIRDYSHHFCNASNVNSNATSFSRTHNIDTINQIEWVSDTGMVFSANCDDNKHKLFYFNYKSRELRSILKPQLEYLFAIGNNLSLYSQSSSNRFDLDESPSSEISLKTDDDKQLKLTQSSSSFFSSQTTFSNYYNSLLNNDLSIRLTVYNNYLAVTIGQSVVEFYSISELQPPKPIEFDNTTVIILQEPSAVSFIHGTDKISVFYKSRYEIYQLSQSFELIETRQYPSELKSIPILAFSFSLNVHLIILENGDIYKFDSNLTQICKIIHPTNLIVSKDLNNCLVFDKNKYVYILNMNKQNKNKLKLKRCDFISNSIILTNVLKSHCLSFRIIKDLTTIDTPRIEQRLHVRSFTEFKHYLNRLCNRTLNNKQSHYTKRKSKPELIIFHQSIHKDFQSAENYHKSPVIPKKLNCDLQQLNPPSLSSDIKPLIQTSLSKTDVKLNHISPIIHNLTASRIPQPKPSIKPTKSAEFLPYLTDTVPKNLIGISVVIQIAETMHLFYLSDLLRSATQIYDPRCYGINLNNNKLSNYLLSYSNMFGDMQKQQINRRQAIYHKLVNDKYGTLSCLLTVDRNDDDSFKKTIMKAALMSVKVDPENYQMMLDVLLENGYNEDATDLMFYSDINHFHTIERFIGNNEIEFAVLAIRMLMDRKNINENQSTELLSTSYVNQNPETSSDNLSIENQIDNSQTASNTLLNELQNSNEMLNEKSNQTSSNNLFNEPQNSNEMLNEKSNQIASNNLLNELQNSNEMLNEKSNQTSSTNLLNENANQQSSSSGMKSNPHISTNSIISEIEYFDDSSFYEEEEYVETSEEMDTDTDDEETDVTESSSQLLDKSSSTIDIDSENSLSSTTKIASSSELELKRSIEKADKKQFEKNERAIKKLEIQQNKNDSISLILRFLSKNKRRHQIVPFLIGLKMFKEAASYLDDFREHQCAIIVRSLVVATNENNEEQVYLDCSLLTK